MDWISKIEIDSKQKIIIDLLQEKYASNNLYKIDNLVLIDYYLQHHDLISLQNLIKNFLPEIQTQLHLIEEMI